MDRATRGRRTARRIVSILAMVAMTLMTAGVLPAHATTPGKNGRIAFAMDKGSGAEIYSIKRDGTGLRKLTSASSSALTPDAPTDAVSLVAVVISASGPHDALDHATLARNAEAQLRSLAPELPSAM